MDRPSLFSVFPRAVSPGTVVESDSISSSSTPLPQPRIVMRRNGYAAFLSIVQPGSPHAELLQRLTPEALKRDREGVLSAIRSSHALFHPEESGDRDVNDRSGIRFLTAAVKLGDLEVLKALLEAGARPNEAPTVDDLPLLIAVRNNRPDLVQCLLEHGANPNVVLQERESDFVVTPTRPAEAARIRFIARPREHLVLIDVARALQLPEIEALLRERMAN